MNVGQLLYDNSTILSIVVLSTCSAIFIYKRRKRIKRGKNNLTPYIVKLNRQKEAIGKQTKI